MIFTKSRFGCLVLVLLICSNAIAESSKNEHSYSQIGKNYAPVTIENYQDHTCGMCRYAFKEILPQILKHYVDQGKAKLVFREFPLIRSDKDMMIASYAQCAGEQRRYLEFVGAMYEIHGGLEEEKLKFAANKAKLNLERLASCLLSGKGLKAVNNDISKGTALKIDGTPTFFINGKPVIGAQPFEELKKIIDAELLKLVNYY